MYRSLQRALLSSQLDAATAMHNREQIATAVNEKRSCDGFLRTIGSTSYIVRRYIVGTMYVPFHVEQRG